VEIGVTARRLRKWQFLNVRNAVTRKRDAANLKSALIVRGKRPLKKRMPSKNS
jgi:hypothetical protein